jgi:hypothetical protein
MDKDQEKLLKLLENIITRQGQVMSYMSDHTKHMSWEESSNFKNSVEKDRQALGSLREKMRVKPETQSSDKLNKYIDDWLDNDEDHW